MPVDCFSLITPAEWKLIRQAKRRGNKKTIDKIIDVICRRSIELANEKDATVARLMSDDIDHGFPTAGFLQRKINAPLTDNLPPPGPNDDLI